VEAKEAEAAQTSNSNSASSNDWNEKGAKLAEDCKKYDEAIRCLKKP
jgi:hypothetical protein